MAISIQCACGAKLSAPEKYAGKRIKCPKCSNPLPVPALSNPLDDPLAAPPAQQYAAPPQQPMPPQQPGYAPQPGYPPQQPGYPPQQGYPQQPGFQQAPGVPPAQGYVQPPPGAQGGWGQPPTAKKPKKKMNLVLTGSIIGGLVLLGLSIYGLVYYMAFSESRESMGVTQNANPNANAGAIAGRGAVAAPQRRTPVEVPPDIPNEYDGGKTFADSVSPGATTKLDLQQLNELVQPSIVLLNVTSVDGAGSIGSGFFVGDEGLIVTNYHVIQGAKEIIVETKDGKTTPALGYLTAVSGQDLAVIQINPEELDCVPIAATVENVSQGQPVAAFGSPQGFKFTATDGTVSSVRSGDEIRDIMKNMTGGRQDVYQMLGYEVTTDWIQTTAPISGGNSGGPLVNFHGELVGVNTWQNPEGQNLNFASTTREVVEVFNGRGDEIKPFVGLEEKIGVQFGGRR